MSKRVGILTLHSQLNYGGVLQCYALQETLREMGFDAVVVDLWMHPCREGLDGVFARGLPPLRRAGLALQSLLWPRMFARQLRHLRTRAFVDRNLRLTDYHFLDWKDAPKDLGVDVLVVGSDQVWHCGDFGNPCAYLLEGAPSVKAVAYAASFGMESFPLGMKEVFERGLRRFSAISVREERGVELAKEAGASATHVLDPTLLADRSLWTRLAAPPPASSGRRRVVCYFVRQDIEDAYPHLEAFARERGYTVDVVTTQLRPHLDTREKRACYLKSLFGAYPHIRIRASAGPLEFLKLFAGADACVTDSFHALMFSCVYNVNCRVLRPAGAYLGGQFARLSEFARYAEGPLFSASVADALRSLGAEGRTAYRDDLLSVRRGECRQWLREALS